MADICVLAFNSVVSDPRVTKQVESLSSAGFSVEVAGFSKSGMPRRTQLHPNAWLQHVAVGQSHTAKPGLGAWLQAVKRLAALWCALALIGVLEYRFDVSFFEWLVLAGVAGSAWLMRGGLPIILRLLMFCSEKVPSGFGAKLESWRWHRGAHKQLGPLEDFAVQSGARIIHCHDLWTLRAGARAARRSGAILIWDAHEVYDQIVQCTAARNAFHRKELAAYQGAIDVFITINESIADYYHRNFPGLPPAEIIKNATPKFAVQTYDGRLHAAAGLPLNQKILLYQGGFSDKRGLQSLVQAAAYLDSAWSLVLMGWGTLENELRALAEEANRLRQEDRPVAVAFVGKAPFNELVQWTVGASIGVIPYEDCSLNHRYCTPNKLWEYPAAGVPVLCNPMVELEKAVVGYKMGWLIPQPMDARSFAETVNRLTEDDIREAQRGCARFIAAENWATYEQSLLNCYRGLMHK